MTEKESSHRPFFFIIGRPRSGTSLLMAMLDANPHIIIPPEIPIIPLLGQKYQKVREWNTLLLEEFYKDLIQLHFEDFYNFNDLSFDQHKIKEEIISQEKNTTFADLIKIVYSNYLSAFPKKEIKLLGDKNPAYSKYAPYYLKLFPEAKFIHIRRDYRDHALSMLRAGFGIKHLAFIAERWKYSMKITLDFKKLYPDKTLMIKFEDLLHDPEKELEQICQFLSVPFYKELMLQVNHENLGSLYPDHIMTEYQSSLMQPLSSEKVGLWKTIMTEKQVRLCDFMVGKYAELAGYSKKYSGFYFKGSFIKSLICIRKSLLFLITKSLFFLPYRIKYTLRKRFSILKKLMT